jgi:hypothetical protein
MGRDPSTTPTPGETGTLIDGARTRSGLSGPCESTSPRSYAARGASRSEADDGGAPCTTGEEEIAGTSKDHVPT